MTDAPRPGAPDAGGPILDDVIDRAPLSAIHARVFALTAAVMILDGADSLAIGLAAPGIAHTLAVPMSRFGPVFGIGQAGVMLGALGLGAAADRLGRKTMIVACTLLFGAFTLATPWCTTLGALLLCRFVTGVGLGGATPNAVAILSEYAPRRVRSALVAALWAGFPLGGAVVGLASAALIPALGWQSLFLIGGVVPLVVAVLAAAALPESAAFLALRDGSGATLARIVAAIEPAGAAPRYRLREPRPAGIPVAELFRSGRTATTLLLWVAFFTSFLILIFIVSWIPALLRAGGLSVAEAGVAIAFNSFGSVIGSGLVGRAMDRLGRFRVLAVAFAAAAVTTALLGQISGDFPALAVAIALAGCVTGAAQAGSIALAASVYPVAARSTGVGWAIAMGRLGAVCGPLVGGMLVAAGWRIAAILFAVALPALLGFAAILALARTRAGDDRITTQGE